ncbi:Rap guanine nucleotide exchange factor [Ceratobasidium sp. AG-Ba]|nr:Rap guanine nucleotide exchange factor [Ceratobasidium sp. AG-Ba]
MDVQKFIDVDPSLPEILWMNGFRGTLPLIQDAARNVEQLLPFMKIHQGQCMLLAKRCVELVEAVDTVAYDALMRYVCAVNLKKVEDTVVKWAQMSPTQAIIYGHIINTDLDSLNKELDVHVTQHQMVAQCQFDNQRLEICLYRKNDQRQAKRIALILDFARSSIAASDISRYKDVLMKGIYQAFSDLEPGASQDEDLQHALNTLYNRTGILPPFTDLTGHITKITEHPVARSTIGKIYKGEWDNQKFRLKPTIYSKGSFIKRLGREILRYREDINLCPHILSFCGTCFVAEKLFTVTPWIDSVDLLQYIQLHPKYDRVNALCSIASGLEYLHSSSPGVIHGDLRAANILVPINGKPLITGYGLSEILAAEDGTEAAITSLLSSGSSRWMAPELFENGVNKTQFQQQVTFGLSGGYALENALMKNARMMQQS